MQVLLIFFIVCTVLKVVKETRKMRKEINRQREMIKEYERHIRNMEK